jgi:hypothetical protein
MFYMFSAMLFEVRLSSRSGHRRPVLLGSNRRTAPRPRRDGSLPTALVLTVDQHLSRHRGPNPALNVLTLSWATRCIHVPVFEKIAPEA